MGDPYSNLAGQYGQEQEFGTRLYDTLNQRQADQPNQLFDRFMKAYQMQLAQKHQAEQERRQAMHEDTYLKMAQDRDALNRANVVGGVTDDISAQYSGDPAQRSAFINRLKSMGVANPEGYVPRDTTSVPEQGQKIGSMNGQDITLPETSADIQKIPGMGSGYARKMAEEKFKAAKESRMAADSAAAEKERERHQRTVETWNMQHGNDSLKMTAAIAAANLQGRYDLANLAASLKAGQNASSESDTQILAERYLRGDEKWPDSRAQKLPYIKAALDLARRTDPSFNSMTADRRWNMQKDADTGKMGITSSSGGTLVQHLAELQDALKQNPDTSMQWLNTGLNSVRRNLPGGAKDLTRSELAIQAVADEAERYYTQLGDKSGRESWAKKFDPNQPMASRIMATKELAKLIKGKLSTDQARYDTAMGGWGKKDLFDTKTMEALGKLSGKGGGTSEPQPSRRDQAEAALASAPNALAKVEIRAAYKKLTGEDL